MDELKNRYELTVDGKKVVLLEHYPISDYDDLRRQYLGLTADTNWKDRCKCLKRFVASWEFDGDPQALEAWGQLDTWAVMGIQNAIGEMIVERAQATKNWEVRSTMR